MKLKNKFFRTVSCVLASAMIAAVLLTGCGGDAPASSAPAASSKPAASTPASSTPASSTPASSKPATPDPSIAALKITVTNPRGADYGNNQYVLGGDLVLTNTSSSPIKISGTITAEQWDDVAEVYIKNNIDEFRAKVAKALNRSSLSDEELKQLINDNNPTVIEVYEQYALDALYYGLKSLGSSTFTAKIGNNRYVPCVVLRDIYASETLAAGKSLECQLVALTPEVVNVEFSYKGTVIKSYSKDEFVKGGVKKFVPEI